MEKMSYVRRKLFQLYEEYLKNSPNRSRTQSMDTSTNSSISSFESSSITNRGKRLFNVSFGSKQIISYLYFLAFP